MSKYGVIISGGTIDRVFVDAFLREHQPEIIIAADSGLNYCFESGNHPTHIVGDFDSANQEAVAYYRGRERITIRQFDPVKDATDTEIAIRYAAELGVEKLWILGATGSRVDHMLANIQCLKIAQEENMEAYMIDAHNRIRLLKGNTCIHKKDMFGTYFSVFPLGGIVEEFSILGAKYPLYKHVLLPYDSRCVSNQLKEEKLQITFSKGNVILVESKDEK